MAPVLFQFAEVSANMWYQRDSGGDQFLKLLLARFEHPPHQPFDKNGIRKSSEHVQGKLIHHLVSYYCSRDAVAFLRSKRMPMSPATHRTGALFINKVRERFVFDDLSDPPTPEREEGEVKK